ARRVDLLCKRPCRVGHGADAGSGQGRAEQEALDEIRLDVEGKDLELLEGLDAFDRDRKTQRTRQVHHALEQLERTGAASDVDEERAVYLDLVERQRVQVAQAGIAGAEIIERDPHAEQLELLDIPAGLRLVVEKRGLCDLDLEPVRLQARSRQRVANLGDDAIVAEVL